LQEHRSGRFQHEFHRVNLHRLTWGAVVDSLRAAAGGGGGGGGAAGMSGAAARVSTSDAASTFAAAALTAAAMAASSSAAPGALSAASSRAAASSSAQGITLVHLPAQGKRFSRDKLCLRAVYGVLMAGTEGVSRALGDVLNFTNGSG